MWRKAYNDLLIWKLNPERKPLVVQGARQVGKTYLVNDFGKKEYGRFVYLNFEEDPALIGLFENDFSPESIIRKLALYKGISPEAEDTLFFFDEIQVAPVVLTSLKYFQEKGGAYHIIAAGSLLGVRVGKSVSFPVGKVNFLELFPMTFSEFLDAVGERALKDHLEGIENFQPFPEAIHNKLAELLKQYLYTGGMPEVVKSFIENGDVGRVRDLQNDILSGYKRDFSKYADRNQSIRIAQFWNSVPGQIARERKKFKYKDIRKGARSAHYELSIDWLRNAGLIHTVYNITTSRSPLRAYADLSKFKVYMHDVGLLGAELGISSDLIVREDRMFKEFFGAFVENFVAQELRAHGQSDLYYWTSPSDAEVDFLLETPHGIVPVEVKSGTNRNLKSLRSYAGKFHPELLCRLSPRNLIQADDFINFPLYTVPLLIKHLGLSKA